MNAFLKKGQLNGFSESPSKKVNSRTSSLVFSICRGSIAVGGKSKSTSSASPRPELCAVSFSVSPRNLPPTIHDFVRSFWLTSLADD